MACLNSRFRCNLPIYPYKIVILTFPLDWKPRRLSCDFCLGNMYSSYRRQRFMSCHDVLSRRKGCNAIRRVSLIWKREFSSYVSSSSHGFFHGVGQVSARHVWRIQLHQRNFQYHVRLVSFVKGNGPAISFMSEARRPTLSQRPEYA